mgnify:FL=1
MKHYLSIDQGTTSSRVVIFDSNLQSVLSSQEEYDLTYPESGWVEVDPKNILDTVKRSIENLDINKEIVLESCGITNQRETTILWEKETGLPIYPGIVWQDRRTIDLCTDLKNLGQEPLIRKKTGLVLDPYFSATKIKWILDNVPGSREKAVKGEIMFGTVDTYLIYNLTKERNHLTDITNASRTSLYNIKEEAWDEELLELFNIPKQILPTVCDCDANFGTIKIGSQMVAITGVIGDQQSALVGQRCFESGQMKSTFGTGCFLMVNTKNKILDVEEGLLSTIAYKIRGETAYAIEGSIYSCGNIVKWMRDKMHFFNKSSESEEMINLDSKTSKTLFLPAFNGLGAPYWDSNVRGGYYGITQDTSKEDLVTAAFESICFQVQDITRILNRYGILSVELNVDGGMIANNTFCQLLANTLDKKIISPKNIESTALGACIVAMIGSGDERDFNNAETEKTFIASEAGVAQLHEKYQIWKDYINKSLV